MQLRVTVEIHPANLAGMQSVFEETGDGQIVTLKRWSGAGRLEWKDEREGKSSTIHMAIPLDWLGDPSKTPRLKESARIFAKSVFKSSDGFSD